MSFLRLAIILFLSLLFAGCAANIVYSHAELLPATNDTAQDSLQILAREIRITLDTGYSRTLRAGSQWMHAGRLVAGQVYRPYKDVFTLEGSDMHEAYLVVSGNRLIGFYLPVERGFSPLRKTLPITFNEQRP